MGGSGSALAMIQSIRDNKSLVGRRRAYFKAKVEAQQAAEKLNITYQKATPEQLRLIRATLKKQRFITRIRMSIVLLIVSPLIWYVALFMWSAIKEEIPKTEGQILMEYYAQISIGDSLLSVGQFENAIILYRRADKLKGDTYVVDYRKSLASTYRCLLLNKSCGSASGMINELYLQDTTNMKVHQLNRLLVNAYNLNNPGDKFVNKESNPGRRSIFEDFFGKPTSKSIKSFSK